MLQPIIFLVFRSSHLEKLLCDSTQKRRPYCLNSSTRVQSCLLLAACRRPRDSLTCTRLGPHRAQFPPNRLNRRLCVSISFYRFLLQVADATFCRSAGSALSFSRQFFFFCFTWWHNHVKFFLTLLLFLVYIFFFLFLHSFSLLYYVYVLCFTCINFGYQWPCEFLAQIKRTDSYIKVFSHACGPFSCPQALLL